MRLVATACAEVGINFDADHAVCDLVALERMIQRFGRVNRFGVETAKIRVILAAAAEDYQSGKIAEPSLAATYRVLMNLPGRNGVHDASPAALAALDRNTADYHQAFSPAPPCPPLDEARIDDWSLTSLSALDFPRPQVSYWLRGVVADDTLHTWLCWRADLAYAHDAGDAVGMAQVVPLDPREVAQVSTIRTASLIKSLARAHGDALAVVLGSSGDWHAVTLAQMQADEDLASRLAFATVFLPSHVGGLLRGLPDASAHQPVADAVNENQWLRIVLHSRSEGIGAQKLHGNGQVDSICLATVEAEPIDGICSMFRAKLVHVSGDEHSMGEDLEATAGLPTRSESKPRIAYLSLDQPQSQTDWGTDLSSTAETPIPLGRHNQTVASIATRLTKTLDIEPGLAEAVVVACMWHDAGKKRSWWQAAVGNPNGEPIAKSARRRFDQALNSGYRHEFGSLLDAADHPTLLSHPHRDLILHLIAAHHGRARPSFEASELDRSHPLSVNEQAARESALRFARLQRKHGWWQLAYLESLVKCADAIASAASTPPL